jgi:putative N6-adenine-specific DNA methylase
VLKRELLDLQHGDLFEVETSGKAAVTFRASREASLYALCWLRSAHRVLELVASSDGPAAVDCDDGSNNKYREEECSMVLRDRQDLHDFVRQRVNVRELLGNGRGGLLTISVKVVMNNPRQLPQDLSHSHFTALTIKNALCDVVREMRGDRPDVDTDNADVPLVAIFLGREGSTNGGGGASLCLYRSLHPPASLHRRGYRQGSAIHKAAMKESLAAGLLIEAGWLDKLKNLQGNEEGGTHDDYGRRDNSRLLFMDPMAGSGSLVVEATMMAADIAPGLMRVRCGLPNSRMPPVTRWKSPDPEEEDVATTWQRVLLEATQRAKSGIQFLRQNSSKIQIQANDIHPGAVGIMESALSNAGLSDFVDIFNMDCYDLDMVEGHQGDGGEVACLVATNPPWGVRLTNDIAESWEGLRHFIRDKCPLGTEVFVLSGDKTATGTLKLKRDRMIPIQTGDQNLRWVRYTIRGPGQTRMDGESDSDEVMRTPRIVNSGTQPQKKMRPASTATGKSERSEWL